MKNSLSFSGNSIMREIFFVFIFLSFFSIVLGFSYELALAQSGAGSVRTSCPPGQLCNPIGTSTLSEFVRMITGIAVKIGVPIAALFIMWAGFKFVTARGDTKAIEDAKMIFWWTIIGTAILLGAEVLSTVLSGTLTQLK